VPLTLRAAEGRYLRVGHKGAAALAPENTLASLEAALAHGVDLVEFDVAPGPGGLVLAHSEDEIPARPVTLGGALGFLAERLPAGTGIDVDLKGVGYEPAVVNALRAHGLVDRAVVCSVFPTSLRRVKALEPGLATGVSYPHDRHGLSGRPWLAPVVRGGIAALRAALPYRIGGMLARSRADAAMLEQRLVSRAVVERCHAGGAGVFAWTVDDAFSLARVVAAGVDGVISNDPRMLVG
jgi:glycerophosphoryl diester phosphodiesterase